MKILGYSYLLMALISVVSVCLNKQQYASLHINPICAGVLLTLTILLLPIWLIVLLASGADDRLEDDWNIDIHYGRSKRGGEDG